MSLCVSGSEGSFLFQSADSKVGRKEVIRMNSIKDVEKLALFRIQESVIPADKEIDTVDIELAEKDIQLPSFDLEQSVSVSNATELFVLHFTFY